MFYQAQEEVNSLFDNDSTNISEVKAKQRKGLKIITSKQMLYRLSIALAQVKVGKTYYL